MTPDASKEILHRVKESQASPAAALRNVQQQKAQILNQQALKLVGKMMLGGLGTGMALRGLRGLYNAPRPVKKAPPQPVVLDIPSRTAIPEEKEADIKDYIPSAESASTIKGVPWMYPAALLGGGAATYGGWKAMDQLLDARRKKELQQDVDLAEQRYRQALLSQYDKTAEEGSLARDLDELTEKMAADWPGALTGMYLTAAPILALLAAHKAYGVGKTRTRRHALEQAKKMRQRQQAARRPQEIFARPVAAPPAKALPESTSEIEQESGVTEGSA